MAMRSKEEVEGKLAEIKEYLSTHGWLDGKLYFSDLFPGEVHDISQAGSVLMWVLGTESDLPVKLGKLAPEHITQAKKRR